MENPDVGGLQRIATECVALVAREYGRDLDWSLESLTELDEVCTTLLADGPLSEPRLDLWWKLVGAYVGEVVVRHYHGQWAAAEAGAGAPAVIVDGVTGYPFRIADRVLTGEPFKTLASFGRALPAIIERQGGPSAGEAFATG